MKSKKAVINLLALLSLAILTGLDQLTKKLAVAHVTEKGDISVIDKVFRITFVKNTGAAWGILKDGTVLLSIFSFIILVFMVFLYFRIDWDNKRLRPLMVLSVFVAAGAIGNLIDRVFLKYVIDFLYFELINFPVFNVADCYITISMFVLAALLIFYYKEEDFENIWRKKSH
ncbi:MAG: signal peptidase II [Lachnospiraceae bacterium]|nr:signal peptidase II [Lachnospiraceae bacterium]